MSWRKIAVNTIYQLIGKGFSILTNILMLALITRALGVAQFGEYVLVTTVPTFLYLFADFGLNAVFLREVAKDNHHIAKFGSLLSMRLILAAASLVFGLAYAFLYPHAPLVRAGIMIALTTVFTQGVFISLNALFQHNLRYELSALAGILAHVFAVALVVWGFLNHAGLLFFVGVWAATVLVLAGAAFLFSWKLPEKPQFSWDPKWVRRIFLLSLPIGLMLVFSQINFTADVFLLRAMDSAEAVGIYRLGYKVFENILPIPIFFVNALYPVMLQDHKQSLAALWERLKKGVWILLASALVLVVLGLAVAPILISILGGADFRDSILVLRVLVISLPVFFLTAPLQWFLITVGREWVLPLIYALAAAFNVWVNFSFIPEYSYFASLFATIASEVLILFLLLIQIVRFKRGIIKAKGTAR